MTQTLTATPASPVSVGTTVAFAAFRDDNNGNITWQKDGVEFGSDYLSSGQTRTKNYTFNAAGTFVIRVQSYAYDHSVTMVVTAAGTATTTALTSSSNPASEGGSVTFTATVNNSAATGTVQFKDGGSNLGSAATVTSGVATYTTSALAAGTHSITAVYSGDGTYQGSTSSAVSQVINALASTTTALTSSANPSGQGDSVTFTATVSNSAATGTVQFKDGGSNLGSPATVTSGVATYATSALSAATHSITAVYSGDSTYAGSTSSAVSQVVNAKTATSVMTMLSGHTVSAYLTPNTTAGTVTFKEGSTSLGTVALSGGSASYDASVLAAGAHTITPYYNGDATYAASSGSPVDVTNLASTTTALTRSGDTLTATVTPSSATGSLIFFEGSTNLGVVTLASGVAHLDVTGLPNGSHTIKADYQGDGAYEASEGTLTFTVSKTSTVTVAVRDGDTVNVAVTPSDATGAVSLYEGSSLFTTGTLSSGLAALDITSLPNGAHSLRAVYGGSSTHATSMSDFIDAAVAKTGTSSQIVQLGTSLVTVVSPAGATGSVQFIRSGVVLYTGSLVGGVATFTPDIVNDYPEGLGGFVSAKYLGSADYSSSVAAAIYANVVAHPYTCALSSSTLNAAHGEPITFTVTLNNGGSGPVRYYDGATLLGTDSVGGGEGTFTTAALSIGVHSILAEFEGNVNLVGASSNPLTLTVTNREFTSTDIAPSGNSLLAYVTPSSASGAVTFYEGSTALATVSLNSGVANFNLSALSSGQHTIKATYAGDSTYLASESAPLDVQALTSTSTALSIGATVTLTATLNHSDATGTVEFFDGATSLGSVAVDFGAAGLITDALSNGTHTITAVYSGDSTYAGSTSSLGTVTIGQAGASTLTIFVMAG